MPLKLPHGPIFQFSLARSGARRINHVLDSTPAFQFSLARSAQGRGGYHNSAERLSILSCEIRSVFTSVGSSTKSLTFNSLLRDQLSCRTSRSQAASPSFQFSLARSVVFEESGNAGSRGFLSILSCEIRTQAPRNP